jgi:DNA-binding CsgD family transcriptional regulator/tetratricopeptide (TPR) repeat protein
VLGRRHERATLDALLAAVRAGHSRALVIRGDAGVGKSVLLEHIAEQASGCRLIRTSGTESEMELAYAGLHQFCASIVDHRTVLPNPQRHALEAAFGLSAGGSPDRFFVGLAVLGLLAEEAGGRPVVCLVDDAQWLDHVSAQTLAFVARRLVAESVAMIFAVRDENGGDELAGLPELVVKGLPDNEARALLSSQLHGPLDAGVRERVVAEAQGNPLALLELPRGMTVEELAGGYAAPGAPLSGRIEESFVRRLAALGEDTRRLVLLAAAEPVGDPVLILRAAARLDLDRQAASPADAAGLLSFGARVRFRHPLVRSAVYQAATPEERRRVHRALAEATDAQLDPDRRAWHRSKAASGPDEDVAAELERSAGRAQARGGFAAAAAFLERAVELSLDPAHRARRALAAAQAKHQAGAPEAAIALLAMAQTGPLDELQRARVELLHGQIAFAVNRGNDAPPLLLRAAKRLASLDDGLARETYRDAMHAAWYAGRLSREAEPLEIAQAVRAMPPSPDHARAPDLLLQSVAVLVTEGPAVGAPLVRRSLQAFGEATLSADERMRWLWLACRLAHEIWDAESWQRFGSELVQLARDAGAATALSHALAMRFGAHVFAGEFAEAATLADEEEAIVRAMGTNPPLYPKVMLAAWQGREAETLDPIESTRAAAVQAGEGQWVTFVHWATAVLYNGLGRYEDALLAAERAIESPRELGLASWALPELVEAGVRSGRPEAASAALSRLSEMTRASGTDWGLGVEAMARALLSDSERAERLYDEAIERLRSTPMAAVRARAHLLYGEWLRRERRRLDARTQLRTAHELFLAMGASGFADRAAREMLATGETARSRTADSAELLTPQEVQIARLARSGLSNPEIAARLFISPRTVQYHLHKVFAKLNIVSRTELGRLSLDGGHGRS